MKANEARYPLVKIPMEVQTTLFLIREELKARKLFRALEKIGVIESAYETHLDRLILQNLDLDDGADETFAAYNRVMEKRTRKVDSTSESFTLQSFKAYVDLVAEKRNRKLNRKQ